VGNALYDYEVDSIVQIIGQSANHINRFVREISYFVIKAVFDTSCQVMEAREDVKVKFRHYLTDLKPIVAQGLADNWS